MRLEKIFPDKFLEKSNLQSVITNIRRKQNYQSIIFPMLIKKFCFLDNTKNIFKFVHCFLINDSNIQIKSYTFTSFIFTAGLNTIHLV